MNVNVKSECEKVDVNVNFTASFDSKFYSNFIGKHVLKIAIASLERCA